MQKTNKKTRNISQEVLKYLKHIPGTRRKNKKDNFPIKWLQRNFDEVVSRTNSKCDSRF